MASCRMVNINNLRKYTIQGYSDVLQNGLPTVMPVLLHSIIGLVIVITAASLFFLQNYYSKGSNFASSFSYIVHWRCMQFSVANLASFVYSLVKYRPMPYCKVTLFPVAHLHDQYGRFPYQPTFVIFIQVLGCHYSSVSIFYQHRLSVSESD